jgi:chromosome segregation ATPase
MSDDLTTLARDTAYTVGHTAVDLEHATSLVLAAINTALTVEREAREQLDRELERTELHLRMQDGAVEREHAARAQAEQERDRLRDRNALLGRQVGGYKAEVARLKATIREARTALWEVLANFENHGDGTLTLTLDVTEY